MQRQGHGAERSRDLERVLTFVDAIAAVAITLLVLPLVDLAHDLPVEHSSVSTLIGAHTGELWAFVLSFVVIAQAWLTQHKLMRPVIDANRAALRWLLLWSFVIVFLPFPTALLPAAGDQALTKVLYIGALIANTVCLGMLAATIGRDLSLLETNDTGPPPVAPAIVAGVLLTVALGVSLLVPAVGYYPLLLLFAGPAAVRTWYRTRDLTRGR